MRDRLHTAIASGLTEVRVNRHPEIRLPNTLSLSFRGLEANRILEAIGLEVDNGFALTHFVVRAPSLAERKEALAEVGLPLESVQAVLLTHTHRDHFSASAATFCRLYHVPGHVGGVIESLAKVDGLGWRTGNFAAKRFLAQEGHTSEA